jgi:predicted nucleic acid-binding Zn ribbon protein
MVVIEKKCSVCGKVFTTLDNKSKYCSAQCAGKARKKK